MWEQKLLQEMSISWTCLHNLPSILSGAPKTRNLRTLPRLSGSDRVHYLSATGIQYAALVSVLSLHLRARTGRRRCCTLAAALDQYEQEPRLHPTRSPEASKPCLTESLTGSPSCSICLRPTNSHNLEALQREFLGSSLAAAPEHRQHLSPATFCLAVCARPPTRTSPIRGL